MSALVLGTGQEVLFQLLSIALWIRFWGVETASEWILLSLLPTLLVRGNAGLFHTATSDLIARFETGDKPAMQRTWRALLKAQHLSLTLVAVLYIAAMALVAASESATTFGTMDLALAALIFTAQFALFQHQQAVLSLVKATRQPATAILWQNVFRLAFIVAMLTLARWFEPLACLAMAVGLQSIVVVLTERQFQSLRRRYAGNEDAVPTRKAVVEQLVRGLQFSAFPFSQIALHTVAVWTLGLLVSPLAAAAFHALRTLSRLLVLGARAVEQAIRIELSALHSRGDYPALQRLLRRSFAAVAVAGGLLGLVLFAAGPVLFRIQTGGELPFSRLTFGLLCLAGFAFALTQVYLAVLFAVNRHGRVAELYVAVMLAACLAAALSAPLGGAALAFICLFAELLTLLLIRRATFRSLPEARLTRNAV